VSSIGFAMAEINKLSVGQALDKLRGTDAPESKRARLDGKIDALDEEIQHLRATRRRLERDQRAAESSGANAQGSNNRKGSSSMLRWLAILAVVGPVLLVLIILYAAQ
jgi:uncharacterized protein YhaN